MKRSEQSGWVLRSLSLTHRDRLTPERACSTLTRTRESTRFRRLSCGVSALPRGFFSAGDSLEPEVDNLETLYPGTEWPCEDKQSAPGQPLSCHASCQHKLGSDRRLVEVEHDSHLVTLCISNELNALYSHLFSPFTIICMTASPVTITPRRFRGFFAVLLPH